MLRFNPQTTALAIACLLVGITTTRVITQSGDRIPNHTAYHFPESVPLADWQQIPNTHALPSSTIATALTPLPDEIVDGDPLAETTYHFHKDQTNLTIEVRYLTNTYGDLKSLIHLAENSVQDTIHQHPDVGSYSIYHDGDRTYLSACLNPLGGSTVTSDDFRSNRYRNDMRPTRLTLWATGQASLQDRRCLVNRLSLNTRDFETPDLAGAAIEAAWFDWADYWQSHYPVF